MSRQHESQRPRLGWEDLAVAGLLVSFIYLVATVAREWTGPMIATAEIHSEPRYLPLYALYSLARGLCAYGVSFLFTLIYGYVMARIAGAERFLLPVLDILQSIPVLGFLPGFVLALVHVFPQRNLGLELASVLMIFTGQAWNMTFSFYNSLKATPPQLHAVARLSNLTWWQRFKTVDLSFAATGLVWNSMMSMAGGWFFLTVSEAFVLGDHDFRLPGLGSYMSLAIEKGDTQAQWMGALTMLLMIVVLDQLVWRPIVAWSQKFTDEESSNHEGSWFWDRIRRSPLLDLARRPFQQLGQWTSRRLKPAQKVDSSRLPSASTGHRWRWLRRPLVLGAILCLGYGTLRYIQLLTTLSSQEWLHLVRCTGVTFGRVLTAVALATCWALPAGVWIGRNPALSRRLQPLIQMAASFPAPMIFPIIVAGFLHFGVGLGISSIALLMVGTQWYVLFNVIAGTSSIPRELWEVAQLGRFPRWTRWRVLILPAVFPSLLTGWITAMGGAWNASIVAEYMKLSGHMFTTPGLGSAISQATEQGDFHVLAAAVGLMAIAVTGFNRCIWHPLSQSAQSRFAMST